MTVSEIQAYWLSSCGDMDLDPAPDSDSWCNYEAAQSELAALREELDGYRAANMVLRDELKTERLRADAAVGDANDAEHRLTAAEQRNAELTELLRYTEKSILWHQAQQPMSLRLSRHLDKARTRIKKAIKPTESGAGE